MKILAKEDSKELEEALDSSELVLFLLTGQPGSIAETIHNAIEPTLEPRRKIFLIEDLSIFPPEKIIQWFGAMDCMDCFAVLSKKDKKVVSKGPTKDLMPGPDKIQSRLIRKLFIEAEKQ